MNFVAKIGRNDPCTCGSGKKYKRCCGLTAAAARLAAPPPEPPKAPPLYFIDDDDLDDVSNSVLDLIKERRFDEALAVCKRLLEEYPDVHDGFDRSGEVHAAMGNHALAADFFRKAHVFAADPVRRADYDEELIEDWLLRAEEQERLAASAAERDRARAADPDRAP